MHINGRRLAKLIVTAGAGALTIFAASKATLEAKEIIDNPELTKVQKGVKIAGAYALAIGSAAVTVLGAKSLYDDKNNQCEAMKTLANERYEELNCYREEIKPKIKDEPLTYSNAQIKRLAPPESCPFKPEDVDYAAGEMIFFDQFQREWFIRKRDDIYQADKTILSWVKHGDYVFLNDWYDLIKLKRLDIGDGFGWGPQSIEDDNDSAFDFCVQNAGNGLVYTVILYKIKGGA